MSVFKKGANWSIDYRVGGKRIRERIGTSKALAEKVLAKRVVEIAEGRFLNIRKEKHYRLEDAASRFVEYSRANKKSFARDECIIRKNLLPAFGKKNLDEITTWDIERYKNRRKQEVSPASVNRELACLKTIYNKAIHWKLVKENPVRGIKFFKENNRRLRFLAPDEARMLIESCLPHLRTIVIVALNTGMRRGEIFNLKWGDVDLDRGQLTIRDSKNGESRTVELNQQVVETLSQLEGRSKNLLVFPSRHGEPYNDIRASFYAACRKAGITDFRFHDLRHTFASHLVMSGVDLTTVKELLGHKTLVMTLRYSHLSQGHKKRAVEVVGTIFGGHFLDTRTEKVAVGQDVPVTQLIDIIGAGDGGRTRTELPPRDFKYFPASFQAAA